jgi:hypothetical protein
MCRETQNLVNIGQMSGTLRGDWITFYCCQWHKFAPPKKVFLSLSVLILFTVTSSLTVHGIYCCFSTGRVVTRTHQNVTPYAYCMSLLSCRTNIQNHYQCLRAVSGMTCVLLDVASHVERPSMAVIYAPMRSSSVDVGQRFQLRSAFYESHSLPCSINFGGDGFKHYVPLFSGTQICIRVCHGILIHAVVL